MRLRAAKQKIKGLVGQSVFERHFDKNKLIFVHIPKTAGTSLCTALYGDTNIHLTASELRFIDKEKFDSYFKFAVVRNPWDRLCSAYFYSSIDVSRYGERSSVGFIDKYRSFESFVKEWVSKSNIDSHYFFYTQSEYVKVGDNNILDYTARFESLYEDVQILAKKNNMIIDIKRMNSSGSRDYRAQYDSEMISIVENVYADDIETFGYEF